LTSVFEYFHRDIKLSVALAMLSPVCLSVTASTYCVKTAKGIVDILSAVW